MLLFASICSEMGRNSELARVTRRVIMLEDRNFGMPYSAEDLIHVVQ
jgi:hypothetical protein